MQYVVTNVTLPEYVAIYMQGLAVASGYRRQQYCHSRHPRSVPYLSLQLCVCGRHESIDGRCGT